MGVRPSYSGGDKRRPLLKRDIETAQANTRSGAEAARYLKVDYVTYRKYAKLYGVFDQHKNMSGVGAPRPKRAGKFGLDEILAGKHPGYDRARLKSRLIEARYLPEECALCGFDKKRYPDGKCPLVLFTKDGTLNFFPLDNLELRCYNCTYLTTGRIAERSLLSPGVYDQDLRDAGLTQDDIESIHAEFMQDDK